MKRIHPFAVVAVALSLLLTACGGSGSSSGSGAGAGGVEKKDVKVGVLPLVDYATVYWAKEKGLFEKEGLNVTLEPLQGGPIGVQKVISGDLDFSFSNTISSTIATEKGAPIDTVCVTSGLGQKELGVFVKPDSPVKTLDDLVGKKVGVNTLNNIGDVTINNKIGSKGKPVYVEVPFNEMINGVKAGSIDAGYVPEPFRTAAKDAGLRDVGEDLVGGPNDGLPVSNWVASKIFVKQNPKTTAAYVRAMNAATTDIAKDEKTFRAWLPGFTKLPAATTEKIALPVWVTETKPETVQRTADILKQQGLVKDFDASKHTYVLKG